VAGDFSSATSVLLRVPAPHFLSPCSVSVVFKWKEGNRRMNRIPEGLRKFLENEIKQMLICFNLTHWSVALQDNPMSPGDMDIEVDYTYLDAEIHLGAAAIRAWKEDDRDYLVACLSHEIVHLITGIITKNNGTKAQNEREETATQMVSKVFLRLYRG
jgi:hypothetical protein